MLTQIVQDLMAAGMSQKAISERVGCSQPYICDIANGKSGKRPGFEIGTKLTDLHREVCGGQAAA